MNKVLVAIDAGALCYALVARLDLNWIAVATERECQRMKKSVISFGHPFADRMMWQMAIVADRDMMVAGVLPRIEMLLHRVAIDTRLRIVAEVAGALAIAECERAKPKQNAYQ